MTARHVMCALVAGGVWCALLSGCSGAGVPVDEVRGGGIQADAADHLSAVTLVRSWLSVLYGSHRKAAGAPEHAGTRQTDFEFEVLPDGTCHAWGTLEDGSRFDHLMYPDGSGAWWQQWSDESTMTSEWDAPVVTDTSYSIAVREKRRDDTRLSFVYRRLETATDVILEWDGTAILSDLRRMQFGVVRSHGEDKVELALEDGARLDLHVATHHMESVGLEPDGLRGATGAFRSAERSNTQTFRITGERRTWTYWEFMSTEGTAGRFMLGESFEGSGSLFREETTVGAFRWQTDTEQTPPTLVGTLDLLTVATPTVGPSAAARDFQIDRWIANIAELGPRG